MKIDSVKIRMYRHGFGDCFLIRYFHGDKSTFSMLIDCGLKLNDKVDGKTIKNVVDDIGQTLKADTGLAKPKLDLLVITHEHWDHVSGFHPSQKYFDNFNIDKIWMAWTESTTDDEAVKMREHITKNTAALHIASKILEENQDANVESFAFNRKALQLKAARENFDNAVKDIASFFGPLEVTKTESGIVLKDKYEISINSLKAMNHVKSFAKSASGIEYLYPGDLIDTIPALPGIRFYVLGPPKSALINKENPSSGAKKEVYMGLGNTSLSGFVDGILQMTTNTPINDGAPFNNVETISIEDAKKEPCFETYYNDKSKHRAIDLEYLNIVGSLAMQLDNDTNNTSLALAIEFVESKQVLLFPADAQVGSWLSWHDLKWEVTNNNQKENIDMKYLFNKTVFYKVGHHASHNATLKELGLELMKSPNLVAFIPEKEEQYSGIPFKPLVDRIKEKTKGRTFFSADTNEDPEKVLQTKPSELSTSEWQAFKNNCVVKPLYIEYNINNV